MRASRIGHKVHSSRGSCGLSQREMAHPSAARERKRTVPAITVRTRLALAHVLRKVAFPRCPCTAMKKALALSIVVALGSYGCAGSESSDDAGGTGGAVETGGTGGPSGTGGSADTGGTTGSGGATTAAAARRRAAERPAAAARRGAAERPARWRDGKRRQSPPVERPAAAASRVPEAFRRAAVRPAPAGRPAAAASPALRAIEAPVARRRAAE